MKYLLILLAFCFLAGCGGKKDARESFFTYPVCYEYNDSVFCLDSMNGNWHYDPNGVPNIKVKYVDRDWMLDTSNRLIIGDGPGYNAHDTMQVNGEVWRGGGQIYDTTATAISKGNRSPAKRGIKKEPVNKDTCTHQVVTKTLLECDYPCNTCTCYYCGKKWKCF